MSLLNSIIDTQSQAPKAIEAPLSPSQRVANMRLINQNKRTTTPATVQTIVTPSKEIIVAPVQGVVIPANVPAPTPTYNGVINPFFHVELKDLHSEYGKVPNKKGVFVRGFDDEKGDIVNVVSGKYQDHQPMDIAAKFQDISDTHGLVIKHVLPNPVNGGLLLSAKFENQMIGGESTDVNLTLYTAHDGKRKTILSLDSLAIACMNQLPILYKNKSRFIFSEKHYANSLDIKLLGQTLENIPASIAAHNEKLETLMETKLNLDDFLDMWVDHYKQDKEAKQFQTKVDRIKAIYMQSPGQSNRPSNSAYKALNAITYANTHEGRETALKTENSLFNGGNDSLAWMDTLLNIEYNEPELMTL